MLFINKFLSWNIFCVGLGKEILVFIGSSTPPYLALYQRVQLDYIATSLVPADFNGDSFVDLLVTKKTGRGDYAEQQIKILQALRLQDEASIFKRNIIQFRKSI